MIFINEELNKSILDPIHGLIRMSEEEMKIISHPLFHRLRKVKQNTFLYYVFPSANHTRFEHSIGVMHLASEMFLNAFSNANTLRSKQKKYNIDSDMRILNMDFFTTYEFSNLFLDLRIAALLHDIGHGPMSHLFDQFAPKSEDFLKMVKNDDDIKFNEEFASSLEIIIDGSEEKVEHEYISYYFAAKVLIENGFNEDRIKRILTIMNDKLNLKLVEKDNFNITPFLNQIVAGAPLDCDRMDYLLRDSYFTGVKYGTYDLNRLLKSLLPYVDVENKKIKLGIKKSGLPAIENFMQARYELYVQVYFHKTNQACNAMLSKATEKLRNENFKFVSCDNPSSFITSYLQFSDEKFLQDLAMAVTDLDDKTTIDDLINRKLWKRLVEFFPEKDKMRKKDIEDKLSQVVKFIIEKDSSLMPFIISSFTKNDPLKDLHEENAVLLNKDENENHFIAESGDWIEQSVIFKALSSNYLLGRVYVRANNDNEKDRQFFREIKNDVQKNFK